MPAGWTTKQIKDGGGNLLNFRVWDEGGPGPYSFAQVLADGDGATSPGEIHLGSVSGITPHITAQMVRPGDATTYAAGDLIGNSQTAGSVVPITFTSAARLTNGSGRVAAAKCCITAASGTIVLPAFDLLLFRPNTNIPFTAGAYPADNAACNISAAAFKELVGILSFSATGWRNQAGGATAAGDHVHQSVALATRSYAPFNLAALSSANILGLLQAQSAWAPGNVNQTFDFELDIDQD